MGIQGETRGRCTQIGARETGGIKSRSHQEMWGYTAMEAAGDRDRRAVTERGVEGDGLRGTQEKKEADRVERQRGKGRGRRRHSESQREGPRGTGTMRERWRDHVWAACLERHGQRQRGMEGDTEGPTKQVIASGEGKESGMGKGTP